MDTDHTASTPEILRGIGVSAGIAVGPALLYRPAAATAASPSAHAPTDPARERERVHEALAEAAADLRALAGHVSAQVGQAEGDIFTAQALMLEDPTIAERAWDFIQRQGGDAAAGLMKAIEEQAAALAELPDPIWQARAADVRDAGRRVVAILEPSRERPDIQRTLSATGGPVVIVAEDLAPSDTVQMSAETVSAIALAQGSMTSHAAILARALGIPAVAGLGADLLEIVRDGDLVIADGERGTLTIHPDEGTTVAARAQAEQYRHGAASTRARRQASHDQPARTRDGHRIALLANVGSEADAASAAMAGAEGIGLLRTEFLFAQSTELPDEQRQADLYAAIIATLGPSRGPIVIRTLDAGADKPLPALVSATPTHEQEANPALGLRGIRLQAAIPDLLAAQLRAVLLAARRTGASAWVMLPMVTTVEEVRAARLALHQARAALAAAGTPVDAATPLGIMVETPAAVFALAALAREASFFSIGTNDLTQYVMAADRLNPRLAALCAPEQPAVLRAIASAVQAARAAKRHISVCGEMASDPRLALLLVGMGIESLSMSPASIPSVREALAARTLAELHAAAERVLRLATLDDVRAALSELGG